MRPHNAHRLILLLTALLFIGIGRRGGAQTTSDLKQQKEGGTVKLEWKLAQGETLFYEQFEEKSLRAVVSNQPFSFKDRRYYLYRWDVMLDKGPSSPEGVPLSLVMVQFGWLQHESTTPEGSTFVDTFAPGDPTELDYEARQMQDDLFGMLRSSFVFFVLPDGRTTLPTDVGDVEVSDENRVPETIQSPRRFTPGDMVGFPNHPVTIGESWTIPVRFENVTGVSRFQLVEQSRLKGRQCWMIEGETTYEMSDLKNQSDFDSSSIGPAKSRYCFDAERGRLIHGEVVVPIKATLTNGQTRTTTVRVTRELIEQPKEPLPINVTRKIAGGERLQLPYRGGLPMNARGEWADVVSSGVSVLLSAQQSDSQRKPEKLVWSILLKPKLRHKIVDVSVEDVTFDQPVMMLELSDAMPKNGLLELLLKEVDISNSLPEWLERDEITERIFKVTLRDPKGDSAVMYQVVQIRSGQLREQLKSFSKQ